MTAGDVAEQGAMRRSRRRHIRLLAPPLGDGETAGKQADCRGFHVAFAAGDLAGEAKPRHRLEP